MIVYERLPENPPPEGVILTVGTFDGLHRGHQKLLGELVAHAREVGRLSAVLTFHPHPRVVLQAEPAPTYLLPLEERRRMLSEMGVYLLIILPFTRALADTSAEAFVAELCTRLAMRELWVGRDFALGRGREGNVHTLQALASRLGYTLHIVEPVYENGKPISSTRIRGLLAEGAVDRAAELLGRPYAVEAEVIHGAERGRRLGFRTANLRLPPECAAPADGVYAVWAVVEGHLRRGAIANIGIRPSFDAGARLLEVHIFDYEGDLYGKRLRVEFVKRLRPERRFEAVEALIAQVRQDIEEARCILQAAVAREGR